MSSNREDFDREIARLFEAQRRADESSAPAVRKLLERPRVPRAPRERAIRSVLLVAAAVIAVVASVVLLRTPPRSSETGLTPVAAQIAAWKAPTDVLLQTSGRDLLSEIPVLEAHASEAATAVLEPTKGVER